MTDGHESFFGLDERPFSLTCDTRYFFPSSSHAEIRSRVTAAVRAHERFQLVTGDLGIGKTLLCHIMGSDLSPEMPVAYVANPLITTSAFERLVTQEFAQQSFAQVESMDAPAVIVIDEAQTITPLLLERILTLSRHSVSGEHVFRFVFVAQSGSSISCARARCRRRYVCGSTASNRQRSAWRPQRFSCCAHVRAVFDGTAAARPRAAPARLLALGVSPDGVSPRYNAPHV